MTTHTLITRKGLSSTAGHRSENQDFATYADPGDSEHGHIAAVADGVSSVKGARVAAQITVHGFIEGYTGLPATMSVERSARRAIESINHWIYAQRRLDESLKGMACTFSGLILKHDRAHVVHVGDSRIYRLRNLVLQCLTVDHVYHKPEQKNVVLEAVGIHEQLHVLYDNLELRNHDRYLLCSDGVHGVLSDQELARILMRVKDAQQAADELVQTALGQGSQDNLSALVVDVVSKGFRSQADLKALVMDLPIEPLPMDGEIVDDYQLLEIVAESRHARIFKARDRQNGELVAIKFPATRLRHSVYKSAFVRELWTGTHVHSPWVGKVYVPDPVRQNRLYAVMPFYEGELLEKRLKGPHPIGIEQGLDIGIKVSRGVATLNLDQIIHRDIKPENIMLLDDGGVRLMDLGVTRVPGVEPLLDQKVPGTPNYMAPEMFEGAAGDEKTDVYALGVTLYRMFTGGYYPYGEIGRDGGDFRYHWISPIRYREDLPGWLEDLLARAVALDPRDRCLNASELADELEAGLMGGRQGRQLSISWYRKHELTLWKILSGILLLALILTQLPGYI